MSQRTFGIEIECGHPGGRQEVTRLLTGGPIPAWGRSVGHDGSGVEVRSPILVGKDGFKQVKRIINFLVANNAYVTTRDGLHVHHGGLDFVGNTNKDKRIRLVESWFENQSIINQLVAPYRRNPNRYGAPLRKSDVEIFKDAHNDQYGDPVEVLGRRALNLENLSPWHEKKTIEIRQFQGCLDPDLVEGWIAFGQSFIESVAKRKKVIATCASTEALIKRVKAPVKATEKLLTTKPVNPTSVIRRAARAPAIAMGARGYVYMAADGHIRYQNN